MKILWVLISMDSGGETGFLAKPSRFSQETEFTDVASTIGITTVFRILELLLCLGPDRRYQHAILLTE